MEYYLIRQCSNCQKILGRIECTPESHLKLSHGVCPDCMEILYKDDFDPESLKRLVESARQAS